MLAGGLAADGFARATYNPDMTTLMMKSALVLAGKVKSVEPSGLTVELTYPTWTGVVFEWLKVEVEVLEPIKGAVKKGDTVRTLMLNTEANINMAPGMVKPKVGQNYLLCLLPTEFEKVYAPLTAPFDDDNAVFILDPTYWRYNPKNYDKKYFAERYGAILPLMDEQGKLTVSGVKKFRKQYQAEIATPALKNDLVYLRWKKETNAGGWQWNAPVKSKGSSLLE